MSVVSSVSISAFIAPAVKANAKYRPLWCETCKAITTHELSGDYYVCDCGESLLYIINDAKEMCAMDLRESRDAQQRFEEWIKESL